MAERFILQARLSGPLIALFACMALVSCVGIPVAPRVFEEGAPDRRMKPLYKLKPGEFFTAELDTTAKDFATEESIKEASLKIETDYLLGPGDRFAFLVRGREDISREEIIVAPDGEVALPRVGILKVQGRTLRELTESITKELEKFYDTPEVTLVMKAYNNNRVFVLGRVANPGAVSFQGPGTLLEALSLAGGLPADTVKSFLSRCMIVRGNDMVMWIDLKELLERGNMSLNARLQNGDVIFIPQSEDQLAYVLGEVKNPGVVPLRSELTLLDAVMTVGGPTPGANMRHVFLVRQADGRGAIERINLHNIIGRADLRKNYALKDGDLIYIPESGIGRVNYFATQISPFFTVLGVTTSLALLLL